LSSFILIRWAKDRRMAGLQASPLATENEPRHFLNHQSQNKMGVGCLPARFGKVPFDKTTNADESRNMVVSSRTPAHRMYVTGIVCT
jgi:hypothetical protein